MFPTLPVDYPEYNADRRSACCVYLLIPLVNVDEPAPLFSRGLLFSHPINTEDTFNLETAAAEFIFSVPGARTTHKLASQTSGWSWQTSRLTDSVEVFSPKLGVILLRFPSQLLPRNCCGAGVLTWNILYSRSEIIRRPDSLSAIAMATCHIGPVWFPIWKLCLIPE